MFIKPEEAGLRGIQAVIHLGDLIKKKVLKDIILKNLNDFKRQAESTLAKDSVIRKELEGVKLVPDDENSIYLYRREGIPAGIMIKFLALLLSKDNPLGKTEKKNLIKKAKALGIRAIVEICEKLALSNEISLRFSRDFRKLAAAIKGKYYDSQYRQGNEVIFRVEDFR